MLKSLFSKVTGLQTAILFKRKLHHKSFLLNFVKFLKINWYRIVFNGLEQSKKHLEQLFRHNFSFPLSKLVLFVSTSLFLKILLCHIAFPIAIQNDRWENVHNDKGNNRSIHSKIFFKLSFLDYVVKILGNSWKFFQMFFEHKYCYEIILYELTSDFSI